MPKISSRAKKCRIPPEINGIQVNHCKNPQCDNYGVYASANTQSRGPASKELKAKNDSAYSVHGGGKSYPLLRCKGCGETPPIKSNLAISDELERLSAYLTPNPEPGCLNTKCGNYGAGITSSPKLYQCFGKTRSGSSRYRCKACKKTFSVGGSTLRQKQPYKNKTIFKLLMNKSPFRRICEIAEIGKGALYWKINFIHEQCLKFAADRERQLQSMQFDRLYLSTDRQDYTVNWTRRKDKRTVQLTSIGTADNTSGYVFGMNLNFDASINQDDVESAAKENGDYDLALPFRRHARLWLLGDYNQAKAEAKNKKDEVPAGSLLAEIESTYKNAESRIDVEKTEEQDDEVKLPGTGMQTHLDYTAYGHFFLLKKLLPNAGKYRFFTDQDSAIRAACLSAFQQDIAERRADAFYIRINKHMVTGQKRASTQRAKRDVNEAKERFPDLSDGQIKIELIKEQFPKMQKIGKWGDRWMTHPFPTMGEPDKAVCYLTDYQDLDDDHLANLYLKATMHPIDRFFMQIRSRLSYLVRPPSTASSTRRLWFGNSAYNPEMIVKVLDIFRVYYNYVLVGSDKKTPAMRLGLAKGVIRIEDILYFN